MGLDVSGIEAILLSIHGMLAMRIPEMELASEEANKLAILTHNVARHYPVAVTQKQLDWTALVMGVATIYGTRLGAIKIRKDAEKKERQEQGPVGNTVSFPGARA